MYSCSALWHWETNQDTFNSGLGGGRLHGGVAGGADLCPAKQADHADARGCQLPTGHALKVGAHAHLTQVLEALHLVHLSTHQHGHGLQHAGWTQQTQETQLTAAGGPVRPVHHGTHALHWNPVKSPIHVFGTRS